MDGGMKCLGVFGHGENDAALRFELRSYVKGVLHVADICVYVCVCAHVHMLTHSQYSLRLGS